MEIIVTLKMQWGKELFYPESKDAHFLTKFTGRPTILKHQLKMAKDRGWKVKVLQKEFDLESCLNEDEAS